MTEDTTLKGIAQAKKILHELYLIGFVGVADDYNDECINYITNALRTIKKNAYNEGYDNGYNQGRNRSAKWL